MGHTWNNIQEIFDTLNRSSVNYVILRNYESLSDTKIFMDGHEDIDLLCDNISLVKKLLNTRKIYKFPGRNSYTIRFNNIKIQIDIRYIGDGYYDTNWEKAILKSKKLFNDYIYVIGDEMYFYTLIYHAIYQKKYLTNEYYIKLQRMGMQFGQIITSKQQLEDTLFQFMVKHGYKFTYTSDPGIILNFPDSRQYMIRNNIIRRAKRKLLEIGNNSLRRGV
ncbi:hypothetical protein D3Z53_25510 [Lachnospiraceae bacterium]|jgi:hypothetical protein|nr:hypothetical protein [Lachnospiraceae bacterium]